MLDDFDPLDPLTRSQEQRSLEEELYKCEWICAKCHKDYYAQNLYAAICNMRWQPNELWPILKNDLWSCSWRAAGRIVADIRNSLKLTDDAGNIIYEDYIHWYCSGMVADYNDDGVRDSVQTSGFVPEGFVTDEIKEDLSRLGWRPVPYEDNEN